MEQMELPEINVTIDVESVIGLTPWVKLSEKKPPCIGWWKTRRSTSPEMLQSQRRWWDGKHFSYPVLIGDDDETAEESAMYPTAKTDIEWCGLKAAYPGVVYPYRLLAF